MAADDSSNLPGPFDVQTIKALVALMSRNDMAEIDLRDGQVRIRLRRGPRGGKTTSAAPVIMSAPPPVAPTPAPAAPPSSAPPGADKSSKPQHLIKSPLIGIFYSAPNPGAEPFVKVGSRITPTTVVGTVEAMKIFNEILAECSGVVSEILVENQQAVEFDQPLFKVDLTA